jgi:hypothetical protein
MTAKAYDYRPFGDSLSATGELPNHGFANMEQDKESDTSPRKRRRKEIGR